MTAQYNLPTNLKQVLLKRANLGSYNTAGGHMLSQQSQNPVLTGPGRAGLTGQSALLPQGTTTPTPTLTPTAHSQAAGVIPVNTAAATHTPTTVPHAPTQMRGPYDVTPSAGRLGMLSGGIRAVDALVNREDGPHLGEAAVSAGVGGLMHHWGQQAAGKAAYSAGANAAVGAGARAVGKGVLSSVGRHIVPGLNAAFTLPSAYDRFKNSDYLGAGMDLASAGTGFIPGIGAPISMGIDALSAARDFYNNRQAKTGSENMNERDELKSFARGFIKAAQQKNVTLNDFSALVKKALLRGDDLTIDDLRAIKADLAAQGVNVPYAEDPNGEQARAYRALLLAERDKAEGQIPSLSAGARGIGAGVAGAAVGGLGGSALGALAKHTEMLNLPYSIKKHMPVAGGVAGAALGGILTALPVAKQKYDAARAYNKLDAAKNIHALDRYNAQEAALMNP